MILIKAQACYKLHFLGQEGPAKSTLRKSQPIRIIARVKKLRIETLFKFIMRTYPAATTINALSTLSLHRTVIPHQHLCARTVQRPITQQARTTTRACSAVQLTNKTRPCKAYTIRWDLRKVQPPVETLILLPIKNESSQLLQDCFRTSHRSMSLPRVPFCSQSFHKSHCSSHST